MELVIDHGGTLLTIESDIVDNLNIIKKDLVGDTYFMTVLGVFSSKWYFSVSENVWKTYQRNKNINQIIHQREDPLIHQLEQVQS